MNTFVTFRGILVCVFAWMYLLLGGGWKEQSQPAKQHSIPVAKSGSPPAGMAWIPAGEFWMGSEEPMFPDARPVHRVRLDGFWIDKTLVTNEQFQKFVAARDYVTIAEKKPRIEDFPGADPAKLVAGSLVFTPPDHAVPL
ncbi:MAG: formylglycine-generating enzyme family protein, partial [Candidatus Acidiferrales bacterium]